MNPNSHRYKEHQSIGKWILLAIVVLSLLGLLFGCKAKQVSTTSTFTERIDRHTTESHFPGVNLKVNWPIADTIKTGDTIYQKDERTGAELKFYRNAYDQLVAECNTKDTVFITQRVEVDRNRTLDTHTVEQPNFFERLWSSIKIAWWVFLILLVLWTFVIKRFF